MAKKESPTARYTARGAGNEIANRISISESVHAAFQACRAKSAAKVERETRVAGGLRALALALGFKLGEKPGTWEMPCPCGAVTIVIGEEPFIVGHYVSWRPHSSRCDAVARIDEIVREEATRS